MSEGVQTPFQALAASTPSPNSARRAVLFLAGVGFVVTRTTADLSQFSVLGAKLRAESIFGCVFFALLYFLLQFALSTFLETSRFFSEPLHSITAQREILKSLRDDLAAFKSRKGEEFGIDELENSVNKLSEKVSNGVAYVNTIRAEMLSPIFVVCEIFNSAIPVGVSSWVLSSLAGRFNVPDLLH